MYILTLNLYRLFFLGLNIEFSGLDARVNLYNSSAFASTLMQSYTHRKGVELSLSSFGMDTFMTWTLISITCQLMSRPFFYDGSNLSHRLDLEQP